jgi:hypothetical protein
MGIGNILRSFKGRAGVRGPGSIIGHGQPAMSGDSGIGGIKGIGDRISKGIKGFGEEVGSIGGGGLMRAIEYLIKFREVIIALVIIAIVCLVLYIVWYCYRVRHPRGMWINAAQDIEETMNKVYNELDSAQQVIEANPGIVSLPKTMEFLKDIIRADIVRGKRVVTAVPIDLATVAPCAPNSYMFKMIPPSQREKEDEGKSYFHIYAEYYDVMNSSIDKVVYTTFMKHFRKLSSCGRDNTAGLRLVQETLYRVKIVQGELIAAKAGIDGQLWPLASTNHIDVHMAVRKLHFYIVGQGCVQLRDMYRNRMFSVLNFLMVLMRPFVDKLLRKEVYARWADTFSTQSLSEARTYFDDFWRWLGYGPGTTVYFNEWPKERPQFWPDEAPAEWPSDWPADWPEDWPEDWPTTKPHDWPRRWPGCWPESWKTNWPADYDMSWPSRKKAQSNDWVGLMPPAGLSALIDKLEKMANTINM